MMDKEIPIYFVANFSRKREKGYCHNAQSADQRTSKYFIRLFEFSSITLLLYLLDLHHWSSSTLHWLTSDEACMRNGKKVDHKKIGLDKTAVVPSLILIEERRRR